ncbi:unnamed protein product [Owenia fusiformis]|uniref:Uncharacterized protein n=1 Tax=Owenia fusiformis TaxID=6347 RepID=A0A8J1XGH0_OWEFU|nr:unnamed protein product [Owenia fusiformis]
MATKDHGVNLSLPSLTGLTHVHFKAVPRRYEETKPVIVQDFSHRKIINIGQEIQKRTIKIAEEEKELVRQETERRIWDEAHGLQKEAVERTKQKCKNEQEKSEKKLMKTYDKKINSEILRVMGEQQKIAFNQVQDERSAGEKRLKDAVSVTEERCHQELLDAVAKARAEERKIAADEATRVAQQHAMKFAEALAACAADKQSALEQLTEKMTAIKVDAVRVARAQEQEIAAQKLADMKNYYEHQISVLKETIQGRIAEIDQLHNDIKELEILKAKVEKELKSTRNEFQNFIDMCSKKYDRGQSEFMIPSMKKFERMKTVI